MWINIEKEILISDKILEIYSNIFKIDIGYMDNYKCYGNNNAYIELSTNNKGFYTNITLFYKPYLGKNFFYEKEMDIKKVELLKVLAKEYNTRTASIFSFRLNALNNESYDYDFYNPSETFMFNSNKELFYIQDEPYPYEKLKKAKYTEEELEKIDVGIVPIYQKKISEEDLISEINRYYDNEINKMLCERKTKDIIISKEEVPEIDLLSQYEYELLLFFKKNKLIDLEYANYVVSTGKLSNKSLSKILNLAQNITY